MNYTDPIEDGTDPIRYHCLFYQRGYWHDQLCSWNIPYICSIPISATISTTQNAITTATTLNPIFETYRFGTTLQYWQDAEKDCVRQNGRLASIHSVEENDYLREEVQKRFVLFMTGF